MTIPMSVQRALTCALLLLVWAPVHAAELPTVTHDGRAYVELGRVAKRLGARLEASPSSTRALLRSPGHVVTLTRNWSQVLVDGKPLLLDAPVLVRRGSWLAPETFVGRVLPRLAEASATPRVAATPSSVRTAEPVTPSAPRPTESATASAARVAEPARVSSVRATEPEPVRPRPSAASLTDLRFRSYPSFTRVVVETSEPATWTIETRGPRQARVRLSRLVTEPRGEDVHDGLVDEVRVERAGDDAVVKVVFAGAAAEMRATALADPPRLMLDLMRPGQGDGGDRSGVTTPLRVLVLDAGHGGHDSGAVGPTGLMEKDVVLDVTRRAARLIEEGLGIKVILSRGDDTFVPLRERTSFANRQRADLFVSIHANADRDLTSQGVEIYFLSSEATDGKARHVAALENAVVKLEKPAARGRGADAVKSILWDLAQSEYQVESSHLAEIALDSMTRTLHIPNRGVKQAGFYVLGGAAMPAVLIEIGFVSNVREEKRLRDPHYRDEIAHAIFDGVAEYKRKWDQRTRTAGKAR
jgi:N-acetylmuramoyl-L-alanine amidase